MKTANIAELRDRLSYYLRIVRRGEPILIRDRDRVIARIDPVKDPALAPNDEARRLAELESRGILRRGEGPIPADLLTRRPKVAADVVAALLAEREEGN